MTIAIKTENLSKIYRLGEIGTGTISRDLERWWAKMRGKEDPFLRIGQTNDRTSKGDSDIVYSLQDINFEIQQGEAVGIIGKNGAGKSTLLKILSRVTSPTSGKININGRVASLLEVGTGFHPELTGRENIYLNGAILGMRKREITRKLDEIIDFSGVERYIDTPVKRYSSGMYVRLAFAVAAHLESEILIVDEVLAVGDAEFQKKCLGKMNDVSKSDGRTILFVSHNMAAIQSLCSKGILLSNGSITSLGLVNPVIEEYSKTQNTENITSIYWEKDKEPADEYLRLLCMELRNKGKTKDDIILINQPLEIEINFEANRFIERMLFSYHLLSQGVTVFAVGSEFYENLEPGKKYKLVGELPAGILNSDVLYNISTVFVLKNNTYSLIMPNILNFIPEETEREIEYTGKIIGVTRPKTHWQLS